MKTYENALILGLGASGCAASELLLSEGTHVCICDASNDPSLAEPARMLQAKGAEVRLGVNTLPHREFDVCVISPGIAGMSPWGIASQRLAKATISELELAFSRCNVPVIAVTGTNGKSTCCKLIADMLTANGMRPMLGGNYGVPFCRLVMAQADHDWAVIEVSSFQLESVKTFRPRVGVLLNIQPDHLTRHGCMHEYARLKASMFARMGEGDLVLLQEALQDEVRGLLQECDGSAAGQNQAEWYSFGASVDADFDYHEGGVRGAFGAVRHSADVAGSTFDNPILGQTAAAAFGVATLIGVPPEVSGTVIQNFTALPHRMERIASTGQVSFINDSKATNLAALSAALDICSGPVHLVAGGRLKEGNLDFIKEKLGNRVCAAYLIGEAAENLENAWRDVIDCEQCGDVQTAVQRAALRAKDGETVLFSPGCASFDQFSGYVERGRAFSDAVAALEEVALAS
ncbi:MAG: UDP-N-acetylmuramoylalanine--D-glutamate ligase [Candidatus Promineifilaceae bacterium]|jgi:UDP-N-acetylmuramoylalanine--D-glutamate ligase